ncbi:MAG: hypothetical protein AAGB14_12825 [Verrucomicrobiota bacterium]
MSARKKRSAKKSAAKKRPGRPSGYSEKVAAEICRLLYESDEGELPKSLRAICRDSKMPDQSTVHRWLNERPDFAKRYAHARELRKDALGERLMKLAREAKDKAYGAPGTGEAGARVQAVKLEIDTIKWILSKEYARDYGDRVNLEHTGPGGGPVKTEGEYKVTPEDEAMLKRIAKKREQVTKPSEG